MVCDENTSEPRLSYNNSIYSNGTRASSSDTSSNDNADYSPNIEIAEAATNAGSSGYLPNGEPPQIEGKLNFPRKVPTRYVLVIMGFLALVNVYMMYLNITVAWPAMVDHNATKLGALDDQKGVFFDKSELDSGFSKLKHPSANSPSKNSHRKETHKQRKRKRKVEQSVPKVNNTINSINLSKPKLVNSAPKEYLTPVQSPISLVHTVGVSDAEKVMMTRVQHTTPTVNISSTVSYEESTTTLVNDTETVDTTDHPVMISNIDLPESVKKDHKKINTHKLKKKRRKRKKRNAVNKVRSNTTQHNNVQVISIVPKVVIKSVRDHVASSTPSTTTSSTTSSPAASTTSSTTYPTTFPTTSPSTYPTTSPTTSSTTSPATSPITSPTTSPTTSTTTSPTTSTTTSSTTSPTTSPTTSTTTSPTTSPTTSTTTSASSSTTISTKSSMANRSPNLDRRSSDTSTLLAEDSSTIPVTLVPELVDMLENGNKSSHKISNISKPENVTHDPSGRMMKSSNLEEVESIIGNLALLAKENTTEDTTEAVTLRSISPEENLAITEKMTEIFQNIENETAHNISFHNNISSITIPLSTTTENVMNALLFVLGNMTHDEIKPISKSNDGLNISNPIMDNITTITENSSVIDTSINGFGQYSKSFKAALPILKLKLPLLFSPSTTNKNTQYNFNCIVNPKSCKTNLKADLSSSSGGGIKSKYQLSDLITAPIGPPFTVRIKGDQEDDLDDLSEEESDESDEYRINKITFNFGDHNQDGGCVGNCFNNLRSMSVFFGDDSSSSSSSSSSEEDDDEEDSEEDDEDDEDEGGEEDDDEDGNEEDDNENGDDLWSDSDDIRIDHLDELYFDNSTNLFKRYDQNGTTSELDTKYLARSDSSDSKLSATWVDEVQYEGTLCEESSEECEETPEEESPPVEIEIKEEEGEEEGVTEEDSTAHRTEGLITLDNEKIPSTVCFYRKKASTTFDGYNIGEFQWEPERLSEVTSAYYWGLLVSQLMAGRLTSMFGGKIIMVQAILFAGVITLLTPLLATAGLYWLLTARLFLGMMLGLVMPALHALLAKWAPPLERTKMVAYTYSGIAIGAAVGGPLSAYLVQSIGWRLLFYGQGITAVIWCILFLLIVYESPNKHKRISHKEKQYILAAIGQQHAGKGLPVPWCNIIRCRHVFSLMLAQGAFVWAWHTLLHYAPLYIASVLHEDLHDVQKVWAAALCCMFVASCVYATIADWARKSRKASTITVRRAANSVCSLVTAVFLVGVAQSYCNTEAVKVCFALAIAMGIPGALCGIFPNSLDLAPNHAASIAGISGAFATTANLLAPYYWQLIVLGQSTLERWRTIWYTSAIFLLLANCLYFLLVGAREQRWNRPIVVTKQPRRPEETTAPRRQAYAPYKNQAYVSTEHL